jgi:modulator of FtsH protease HflC
MVKRFPWMPALGLLLLALFALAQVLTILREGEIAVLTTFEKPRRVLDQPGLYLRWPWPVQRLYRFDARVRVLESTFEQTLTRDGKNVVVMLFAGWRVQDPLRFLERVGTVAQAELNLNGLISNYKNAVLGQHPFAALVNTDAAALKFDEIEGDILTPVRAEARERYGVEIEFLGIRKLALPEAITERVFERMRAERMEASERYRAEGEGEAIAIRAEADSRRDQRLAGAEAEARRLRAAGDAAAAEYFQAFEQDPELAIFLRKLEVLYEALGANATVVLGADTPPFDLLRGALPEKK